MATTMAVIYDQQVTFTWGFVSGIPQSDGWWFAPSVKRLIFHKRNGTSNNSDIVHLTGARKVG